LPIPYDDVLEDGALDGGALDDDDSLGGGCVLNVTVTVPGAMPAGVTANT